MQEPQPSSPRPRSRILWGVAGACLVLGVVYAATNRGGSASQQPPAQDAQPPAPRKHAPAGPTELALLAPLEVGAPLGSYKVTRIDAVEDGLLALFLAHGDTVVELDVALVAQDAPLPPARVDPYAIYYAAARPDVPRDPKAAPNPDVVPLASALASVISRNLSVPRPPGIAVLKRE